MTGLRMNKILVVDDELSIRESFSLILEGKYKVLLAASGEGALKTITDQKVDLVYLDIRMPGLDGLETLKRMKEIDPELEIVMVTAVNDVQKASEAIKLGARDYIVKPFDVESVLKMTESILRRKMLLREGEEITKRVPQLIGQSEKMAKISRSIQKIAAEEARVLILGEPGTEKEVIAELIHRSSNRADFPFQTLNLSAQRSSSEIKIKLFGTAKGSTTVELRKITGLLEKVRGGTVFLNHIEYLPAEIISELPTEVRLISGSNLIDLSEKSKEIFDFFSEVLISIPPLRERISDLPLLINHLLERFSEKYGKEVSEVSPEALEALSNYSWPGNIAELEALMGKLAIAIPSNKITTEDLPIDILLCSSGAPGSEYLEKFAAGRTRTGTVYSTEGF